MRLSLMLPLLLACSFAAGVPGRSSAGVPNASTSSVPPILTACPMGDLTYVVTVRDAGMNPVPNAHVSLDFSDCPNIHFCPTTPPPAYVFETPTTIALNAGALGQAVFYLEAGGTCSGAIQIYADGVLLTDGTAHPLVTVANADQTGDAVVSAEDAALLAAKPANDPTADLNGDGIHDTADETLMAAHLGHLCPGLATPNSRRSWGGLKLIYR